MDRQPMLEPGTVAFVCSDGECVHASLQILHRRSIFFARMVPTGTTTSRLFEFSSALPYPTITSSTLRSVFVYLYTGGIPVVHSWEAAVEVLKAADFCNLEELETWMVDYLIRLLREIHIDQVASFLSIALMDVVLVQPRYEKLLLEMVIRLKCELVRANLGRQRLTQKALSFFLAHTVSTPYLSGVDKICRFTDYTRLRTVILWCASENAAFPLTLTTALERALPLEYFWLPTGLSTAKLSLDSPIRKHRQALESMVLPWMNWFVECDEGISNLCTVKRKELLARLQIIPERVLKFR